MTEIKVTAKLSRLRIAPRKVRLVADLIRRKSVEEARQILKFAVKAPAKPMTKLLDSAVANARHNFKLEPENLVVGQITVDEGPMFKRFRAESRGRTVSIQKKTAHITMVLSGQITTKKKVRAEKVRRSAKKTK